MIYTSYIGEGELNGDQHAYCPFWSCTVQTKINRVANIKKTVLPVRKMMISTVNKWLFALLLLTNPLPYTIRHNIAMELVAIGGPLPLTI
jgi:hypothetical protein